MKRNASIMNKIIISLTLLISFLSSSSMTRDEKQSNDTAHLETIQRATKEVENLVNLSWDYMYENTDSAYYFGLKAVRLSKENNLLLEEADAYNALGVTQIVLSDYDAALTLLNNGMNVVMTAKEKYIDPISPEYKRRLNRELGLLSNIGNCYYHTARYQQAIEYYQKGNKIAEQVGGGWKQAVILSSIGSSFNELKKFDLSLQYQRQSLEIAYAANDSSIIANTLTNIGTVYFLMNEIEKSKLYTKQSIAIYKALNQKYFLPTVYLNLAQNYIREMNFDSANFFLDKTEILLEDYPEKEAEIFFNYQKGQYEEFKKKYVSAIKHYKEAYLLSIRYDLDKYRLHASYMLENAYALLHQYDSAYYYLKVSNQYADSVFSKESDEKIAEIEVKYQVEKKELNIQNLEKQKALDKQVQQLLLILLVVIIFSSVLIIVSYVLRRKRTKQLHETEKKLMATKLEKNLVQQQKLTEDIEHKTKQLTTHALNMMQKNKLLQEVNSSIADIVKNPTNLEESFRLLKRQINRSIKADDDWEVFKMYFEQINKSFFDQLRNINPDLSTHDLRLCALIKLNLNIKESAAVLNLSPNSIKSARYKLRKRLSLQTEDDLGDFIQAIA
jgi:tetratricopeptide (TPR) repeat protein